ncbi:hypothetical protein B0H13DRAFT_2319419 [Mycena leptocephala]|nr:hypothetical protein B0H13DRAFT_2319419 [Mycena leptocephala]
MIGTPLLNAAQMVQAQVLRDRLTQEMAVRNQINPDDASNASRLDSSPPEDPLTGTVRSRDDADGEEFPSRLADPNAPYTLEEGRAFKRHKNLSGQSDNDAEIFLKARLLSSTTHPTRHLYQLHIVGLQCRNMLHIIKADEDKKFKLTDITMKTSQDYAHCAVLSPSAKNYRNIKEQPTIAAVIVGVMRALGISDLPPAMETGRVEVLIKYLSKALTAKRYHIKSQIVSSIKDKVDIATLTRACIGTSPAAPTVAVYQRIALLRSIAAESNKTGSPTPEGGDDSKDESKDKFWPEVDSQLAVYYQIMGPAERQVMYDAIYREDIATYGEPDNAIPLTLMQDVDGGPPENIIAVGVARMPLEVSNIPWLPVLMSVYFIGFLPSRSQLDGLRATDVDIERLRECMAVAWYMTVRRLSNRIAMPHLITDNGFVQCPTPFFACARAIVKTSVVILSILASDFLQLQRAVSMRDLYS